MVYKLCTGNLWLQQKNSVDKRWKKTRRNNLGGINNIKGDFEYQYQIGWFVAKIQGYGSSIC